MRSVFQGLPPQDHGPGLDRLLDSEETDTLTPSDEGEFSLKVHRLDPEHLICRLHGNRNMVLPFSLL